MIIDGSHNLVDDFINRIKYTRVNFTKSISIQFGWLIYDYNCFCFFWMKKFNVDMNILNFSGIRYWIVMVWYVEWHIEFALLNMFNGEAVKWSLIDRVT